jgi:hypothetical protein
MITIGKDWSEKDMELKNFDMKKSTMAYLDMGNGKPIVLLHGFCGSSRYWEKVIPSYLKTFVLSPRIYQVMENQQSLRRMIRLKISLILLKTS